MVNLTLIYKAYNVCVQATYNSNSSNNSNSDSNIDWLEFKLDLKILICWIDICISFDLSEA